MAQRCLSSSWKIILKIPSGDCSSLTNADVGDGVYSMMTIPGSRGPMLTLVDGEVVELGHHSAPKLQKVEVTKDDDEDDGVLDVNNRILRIHAPSPSPAHEFHGR